MRPAVIMVACSAVMSGLILTVSGCGETGTPPADVDLLQRLEDVRVDYGLPAVAGGYDKADGEMVIAVSGLRRFNETDRVQPDDLFHLGSVTKPFTATLAAVMVQEGMIEFDTTLGDSLGTLVPDMNPEHRYSNAGYSVAAVMLEATSGQTWEELMESRLLGPLGIRHFGFGWPVETGRPGTWGHRVVDGSLQPHDPSSDGYRLEDQYIGPAGDLALDIEGMAIFARLHLLGLQGADLLLPHEVIRELHRPIDGDDYALGWNVHPNRSTHVGSAETAFASIYLMRNRDIGLVVATNAWSENEEEYGAAL